MSSFDRVGPQIRTKKLAPLGRIKKPSRSAISLPLSLSPQDKMTNSSSSSLSSLLQTIAQVATSIIAVVALLQTNAALQRTDQSLTLLKQQIDSEATRHKENRKWAIKPILTFQRGVYRFEVAKGNSPRLDVPDGIGKIMNLGTGAATDISVDWDFNGIGFDSDDSRIVLEQSIIPSQGIVTVTSLPKAFSIITYSESKKFTGKVKIQYQNVDGDVIALSQPFTMVIERHEEAGMSAVTFQFDFIDKLDLRLI